MKRPKPLKRRGKGAGFTLIELMVVISIIVLLMSILVPALNKIKDTANRTKSATQVRGIHQGIVNFAQGNGSQEYFVGLNSQGRLNSEGAASDTTVPWTDGTGDSILTVEARLAILLGDNYFAPDYLISPSEAAAGITAFDISTDRAGTADFTEDNYSYALLQVDDPASGTPGRRVAEWRNTLNSQAPVVGDRVIGVGGTLTIGTLNTYSSLYSENGWRGNVAYNDGHVTLENSPEVANTKYGGVPLRADDLFADGGALEGSGAGTAASAGNDAAFIVKGNSYSTTNVVNSN